VTSSRWTSEQAAEVQARNRPAVRRDAAEALPKGESALAFQCRALRLPEPVDEFRFHEVRRWKFDHAWPAHMVALEREGIVYPPKGSGDHRLGGRHVSVKGFRGDIEKYAVAASMGWRVVRVLPEHVTSGQAMLWVEPLLRAEYGQTLTEVE
jgi:hypothetical protein